MKESDQLVTSFITPFGMYCYVTMPFGLRNAGAMYQRCMTQVFGDNIGQTIEAYLDDIVVKTRKAEDLVDDLRITFKCLREKGIKLNPVKSRKAEDLANGLKVNTNVVRGDDGQCALDARMQRSSEPLTHLTAQSNQTAPKGAA